MPRKSKHHYNYEDEYDYSYDDDYDYGYDNSDGLSSSNDVSKVEQFDGHAGIWRCLVCTYDNLEHLSACDMCGGVRNTCLSDSQIAAAVDADASKVQQSDGQFEFWRCSVCTYDNPEHLSMCDICRTVRHASFAESQTAAAKTAGPYLLEAIDRFQLPTRDTLRPLRLPISEVMKSRTLGHVAASGKLEGGAIRIGTKILVMPTGETATIKAIEQDGEARTVAKAGDSVDIGLQGIHSSILMTGGILCHPDFPVPVATRIELKVAILDIRMPILFGSQVELHAHHAKEAAKIVQLSAVLDPKTGIVRKKTPRCLTANQSALIEVLPEREICIEEYSNYRALGRVTLRAAGKTIAVGIVTRVVEQK